MIRRQPLDAIITPIGVLTIRVRQPPSHFRSTLGARIGKRPRYSAIMFRLIQLIVKNPQAVYGNAARD